eukprot:jgi/Bigna1/73286/fgenesh1_pg.23_\
MGCRNCIDVLIIVLQSYFLWSCIAIERHYCHQPLSADSTGILKTTYEYAIENNRLFASRPDYMVMATCISAYGLGTLYALVLLAFTFKWNWIRMIAILLVGAKAYALGFYHLMEFTSDTPPENLLAYWGPEFPYILSLVLLLARTLPGPPFQAVTQQVKPTKED